MSVVETTTVSDFSNADEALKTLQEAADRWVNTGLEQRVQYLDRCMTALARVGDAWAQATSDVRSLDPGGISGAEPWLTELVPTMRCFRLLRDSLRDGGQPQVSKTWRRGDRHVVRVFPSDLLDAALFAGMTAEVHIEPDHPVTQGRLYRDKAAGRLKDGKVGLVLGAGNVGSICPTDALYKLFVDDEVVLIKSNPVNAYLSPYWRAALKPLIDDGFVRIVDGGVGLGVYLCNHSSVHSIHITGSDRTYDAIVWGPDIASNKAKGERQNDREVSAELGCVTPVMVVPGAWSKADIRYHATNIASMVTNNGSFNCVACKLVVLDSSWPQKDEFLSAFRQALQNASARQAYYPGAQERYQGFRDAYPNARVVGTDGDGVVPWTIIDGIGHGASEYALANEAFCGVVAVTEVAGGDAAAFLRSATDFCNSSVWGTLSCSIIIDRRSQKVHAEALEQAIDELNYGGIAINVWSGIIFGLSSPPWGAAPGHTAEDIRSGNGHVHNTYMIDRPVKTVLRAPFRIFPLPAWFDGHKGSLGVGKALFRLERDRSWSAVPS
ncbi:MAG: aldehyde dehydrogenase family protein, partial [Myxococcota bacterium]|nr:aldehyde dehydrogenase family protein [Myxococcota bacterium]